MDTRLPKPPIVALPNRDEDPESYSGKSMYTYDGKHADLDGLEKQIVLENAPILAEFKNWLISQGYAKKTVRKHYHNAELFAGYLYFREPCLRLIQAKDASIFDFYSHYVKYHVVAAKEELMALPASLKKMFVWMEEVGYLSKEDAAKLVKKRRKIDL